MEYRLKPHGRNRVVDESSFGELNDKLLTFRRVSEDICKKARLPKVGVAYSYNIPIAAYRSVVNECLLNPYSIQFFSEKEIKSVIGHEVGHSYLLKVIVAGDDKLLSYVSRKSISNRWRNEYLADRFTATMTDVESFIGVLEKRDAIMELLGSGLGGFIHNFFSMIRHPPTNKRIEQLRNFGERLKNLEMETELSAMLRLRIIT